MDASAQRRCITTNQDGGNLFPTTALLMAVGPTFRASAILDRPTASAIF